MATAGTSTPSAPQGDMAASRTGGSGATNGHERLHGIASTLHQTIDKLEHLVSARTRKLSSGASGGGQQVRQYGEKLRAQMDSRPLAAIGVALAAGMVLSKLFGGRGRARTEVRIVEVPVYKPADRHVVETGPALERRAAGWKHAATSTLDHLGARARAAMHAADDAARRGVDRAAPLASRLASGAAALPLHMRAAAHEVLAKTHEVGSRTRYNVQAHPLASGGAVLGIAAIAATLWMRKRAEPAGAYVAVDQRGNAVVRGYDDDMKSRAGAVVASRPVGSAVVALGIGALAGYLLRRH